MSFPEAPQRFLTVDHRPTQAAIAVVGVEIGEVMGFASTKSGIFLKQTLLDVKAEILGFVIAVFRIHVRERKGIDLTVRKQHLEQCLALVLRISL